MGSCASTDAKNRAVLHRLRTPVVVKYTDEGVYYEQWGFTTNGRYDIDVTLDDSPTWIADNMEHLFVAIPCADEPLDLRPYIAHKVACMNWANKQENMTHHFCMSWADKFLDSRTVGCTRQTGRFIEKTIDIRVSIEGDVNFLKFKTTWPEVVKPCRDLLGFAEPDFSKGLNAVRVIDGQGLPFAAFNKEEAWPVLQDFSPQSLSGELEEYYKAWRASDAKAVFANQVKKNGQQWYVGDEENSRPPARPESGGSK